jgi:hypothetical protein
MPVHVSHPDGRPRKSSEQVTTASFAAATGCEYTLSPGRAPLDFRERPEPTQLAALRRWST